MTRSQDDEVLAKVIESVPGRLLLFGVGGSHAYGTNRPGSDRDYRGVYVAPTEDFLGVPIRTHAKPYENKDLDIVIWELGHFCELALKCNPNMLEILHLDGYLHFDQALMPELHAKRDCFLSGPAIRSAYSGFANAQVKVIANRWYSEEAANPWPDGKEEKFLLHAFRLIRQGIRLLGTGHVELKVQDVNGLRRAVGWLDSDARTIEDVEMGKETRADRIMALFEKEMLTLRTIGTQLPNEPNLDAIDDYVIRTRRALL